ncbi:MAG TPA: ABC transporter substrate-binding protein, partial [Candidatus Acidoferrales bacterium]|nr:ABC transporter substrate-binding protein [Candidatus Acidoferrales bacterium]
GWPDSYTQALAAFQKGLNELGFVDGQNLAIEYRWAGNEYAQFTSLVADLVRRQVNVVVVLGSTPGTLAAKAATTTIPIVFGVGGDPVALGLVASFRRPGGNMTGVTLLNVAALPKRLGLLHELVPTAAAIALLVNPSNPLQTDAETREMQAAARALGLELHVLNASSHGEFEAVFTTLLERGTKALVVQSDGLFTSQRDRLVALAARYAVPAIYGRREIAEAGGLMSYANDLADSYRQAGIYCGRILKGEKPADLPVVQPTKFEFVINLKTARTLGLTVPPGVLAIADEVIE